MNTPAQNLKFMNRTIQLDKIVKPSSNCGAKLRILCIITAAVCEQTIGTTRRLRDSPVAVEAAVHAVRGGRIAQLSSYTS